VQIFPLISELNFTPTSKHCAQQQFAEMAGFGLNLKLVLYLQSQ
jgi:hypothetical protein